MNDRLDIELVLERWFDDGPSVMPDRVTIVVADRIARQRQQRTWRLPWRFPPMTTMSRLLAVAALATIAVAGAVLLGGGTTPQPSPAPSPGASAAVAGPSTAPTAPPSATPVVTGTPAPSATLAATPTPQPSVACRSPQAPTCQGRLEPGTHDSVVFTPPFQYTVPEDWWNLDAWSTTYQFHRFGDPADQQILMYSAPGIAPLEDDCEGTAIEGTAATVDDWVTFLTSHPGLDATSPEAVDIGGRDGVYVDIAVRDDWTRPCPYSEGRPYVRYATDVYWPFDGWGIADKNRRRVVLVDGPTGWVVLIEIATNLPEPFEPFLDVAMPIVESITFNE